MQPPTSLTGRMSPYADTIGISIYPSSYLSIAAPLPVPGCQYCIVHIYFHSNINATITAETRKIAFSRLS